MSPEVDVPSYGNLKVQGAQQVVEEPNDPLTSESLRLAGLETAYDNEHLEEPLFFSCPSSQEQSERPQSAKPSSRGTKDTLRLDDRPEFHLELDEFLDTSAIEDPMGSSPMKPGTGEGIRRYSPPPTKLKKEDENSFTMPLLEREIPFNTTVPITLAPPASRSLYPGSSIIDMLTSFDVATSTPSQLLPQSPFNVAPARALGTARTAIIDEVPAQDLELDDLEDWLMGGNVEIVD